MIKVKKKQRQLTWLVFHPTNFLHFVSILYFQSIPNTLLTSVCMWGCALCTRWFKSDWCIPSRFDHIFGTHKAINNVASNAIIPKYKNSKIIKTRFWQNRRMCDIESNLAGNSIIVYCTSTRNVDNTNHFCNNSHDLRF